MRGIAKKNNGSKTKFLFMVDDVGSDAICLCIEDDTGGMSPDNAAGLAFLRVGFKVRYITHDDVIDCVTSIFPVDSQDIAPLPFGFCFVVVIEEAFWFHWTCSVAGLVR